MQFKFTKNNTLGSRLICWALDEPVSHVAVEFSSGLVVHSKLFTGVTLEWHTTFANKNQTLYTYKQKLHWTEQRSLLKFVLDAHANSRYDYGALAHFAFRVVLYKLCKIPYPKEFRWSSGKKFLCTELALKFTNIQTAQFISPFQLYKELEWQDTTPKTY